jgi:hypothetical protein
MPTDFGLAWRTALIALLSTDSTMQTLLGNPCRIYDNVPKGTPTPYIRLGDDVIVDYGDKDEAGQEFTSTIHFYDQSPTKRGQHGMNAIQARVYELLHECSPIIVSGGRSTYLVRFIDRIVRNTDGTNWHGIDRYRVLI